MKIYIAGSISDNPNYFNEFQITENRLTGLGHTVLNPIKNLGFDYKDYIDMGLNELMHCDAIYMLKGYEKSKGAMLEKHYATVVGIKIIYEGEENVKNS